MKGEVQEEKQIRTKNRRRCHRAGRPKCERGRGMKQPKEKEVAPRDPTERGHRRTMEEKKEGESTVQHRENKARSFYVD